MAEGPDRAAGAQTPAVGVSGDPFARGDAPVYAVTLWPHQSMTSGGFRGFVGVLAAGLALPVLSVWGTPVMWFLIPFMLAALALVVSLIRLNQRQRRLTETLRLWPDAMTVERREPDGRVRRWAANPYWVRLALTDTPAIERYLTLSGGDRTIELGAFLTPEERVALADEIEAALRRAGGPATG